MASTSFSSLVDTVARVISNNDVVSETPFLDETEPHGPLAHFQYNELTLGKLLERGRFAETRDILAIDRDLRFQATSAAEEKARLRICRGVVAMKGQQRLNYSVKHVRTGLETKKKVERALLGLTIEANYLARLKHPNIMKLKGLCSSTVMLDYDCYEYHAIITNRITESLGQRIDYWNAQKNISIKSDFILHLKTDYAFQIADALSYLHDRRIIFRNLNLDNIGFTKHDTIQLVNFDCVKEIPFGESYLQDGFVGVQTYMALEIYQEQQYDFKADSFAWAICFYEMLTQKPAFQTTKNGKELIRERGWCPSLQSYDFVPIGVRNLLEEAWEIDQHERASMKGIKNELEWILFGGGGTTEDQSEEDLSLDTTRRSSINASIPGGYRPFLGDESILGLDIDESSCDQNRMNMQAAIGFSGKGNSFIPSDLLLLDASLKNAPAMTPAATNAMEHLIPKLEYTRQYRGLRKDSSPPIVAPNTNHGGRRPKKLTRRNPEMAICA